MKKKLFLGMMGLVVMAAAVCVTLKSSSTSTCSDLMVNNLEALTYSEGDDGEGGTSMLYPVLCYIDFYSGTYTYQMLWRCFPDNSGGLCLHAFGCM